MSKARTLDDDLVSARIAGDNAVTIDSDATTSNNPARNKVQNKEAMTQGESSRAGMSSTIYTGNGATQSITTGVDMATGDFGGLVWIKDRSLTNQNKLVDTVRGIQKNLASDTTAVEEPTSTGVSSFDADGVSMGSYSAMNTNTNTYVAWSFGTTKKASGLTNRNKAYTCHYNPDMNFSIVGYIGDGVDGHEIPHHLPVVPELTIFKNRDIVSTWFVKSPFFDSDQYLNLGTAAALAVLATASTLFVDDTISLGTHTDINGSGNDLIAYNFASKSRVCKIGTYIGTGAVGNYVSTEVDGDDAFKPSFVMVKNLTGANNWVIVDSIRGDNDIHPDLSNAESALDRFNFIDNGIECISTHAASNALNAEYIFMAFAETSIDATKALTNYDYATTADTISIVDGTLVSVADGFNANGQVDTQFQFGSGVTKSYGVGHEDKHYFVYTDKLGNIGESEVRNLSGMTRKDADRYGLVSPTDGLALDIRSRTTDKHFDYESASGVALASGDYSVYVSWKAFNKDTNDIVADSAATVWQVASITTSWLQYKHTEKRILRSWRMREGTLQTVTPRRFTIEGSNDGMNWTALDSTYTSADYTGNGLHLWGELQGISGNTISFLYHRINITANNGEATYTRIVELEFNTISLADYMLIGEGVMYNSSDTAIERTYFGELKTDSDGDVIKDSIVNYPVAEQEVTALTVHEKATFLGDVVGKNQCTAWVNVDTTQNPPLIRKSYNIKDIVDLGVGQVRVIFKVPMDNIGYTLSGAAGGDGVAGYSFINEGVTTQRTVNYIDIYINSHTATFYNAEFLSLNIYGGRKL